MYRRYRWLEVVDEIKPLVDKYIDKPNFGYDELSVKTEEIALCGTVSEICVVSNAAIIKAQFPEVPLTVYENLCAGLGSHKSAMDVMKSIQINVVS